MAYCKTCKSSGMVAGAPCTECRKTGLRVLTVWETATYDVWGNAEDGFEVNNTFRDSEPVNLTLKVETFNVGTEHEFKAAFPTDRQIQRIFNVRCKVETDGDDLTVYVNREKDGYPLGEMHCTSHVSLSPIRTVSACGSGSSGFDNQPVAGQTASE